MSIVSAPRPRSSRLGKRWISSPAAPSCRSNPVPAEFCMKPNFVLAALLLGTLSLQPLAANAKDIKLLNVSYDPTRELYKDINAAFTKDWKAKTGQTVTIQQSHG